MQKEQFKKYITYILDYHKELDKWCDTLGSTLFDAPIFHKVGYLADAVIDYLGQGNEELTDLISWWLYEDVDKVLYYKDKEISVKTIDELYNYIKENYYDNKGN